MFAEPCQHIQPTHQRHLQVDQQDVGEGESTAIGVRTFTLQIIQGFVSVAHDSHGVFACDSLERRLEQMDGVVIIFGVTFSTLLSLYVVPSFYALLAPFTGSPEALSKEIDRLELETPEAAGKA